MDLFKKELDVHSHAQRDTPTVTLQQQASFSDELNSRNILSKKQRRQDCDPGPEFVSPLKSFPDSFLDQKS